MKLKRISIPKTRISIPMMVVFLLILWFGGLVLMFSSVFLGMLVEITIWILCLAVDYRIAKNAKSETEIFFNAAKMLGSPS